MSPCSFFCASEDRLTPDSRRLQLLGYCRQLRGWIYLRFAFVNFVDLPARRWVRRRRILDRREQWLRIGLPFFRRAIYCRPQASTPNNSKLPPLPFVTSVLPSGLKAMRFVAFQSALV